MPDDFAIIQVKRAIPRACSAHIVINATPSCVAVLGLPDTEWLAALQAQLPPETEIVELDARAALVDSTDAGQTLIRIQANAVLPPYALQRLLAAAESVHDYDVISATDAGVDVLTPLPEAQVFAGDTRALDAACWLLGARSVRPCDAVIGALAWMGPEAAARIKSGQPLRHGVIDSLHVAAVGTPLRGFAAPEHRHIAAPATALAALRTQLGHAPTLPTCWPGLDTKPVVLHVLHGWGGGVERFALDLADGDDSRLHLALFARGEFSRSRCGESLELALLGNDRALVLAHFDLAAPIATCAIESSEWRAVFTRIRERFSVGAVIVSSLIGHALDALDTGLPTEFVCHDYFPLWPILHADFGDSTLTFDRAELTHALASAKTPEFPFAEREPAYWQSLRTAFAKRVHDHDIVLVAPTRSLRQNWLRLAPELTGTRFERIGHGLRSFPAAPAVADHAPRTRLRILVLGRLNGGKGEHLLRAALAAGLRGVAELFLLGCGRSGQSFLGERDVHVIDDYTRDDLPRLLAHIQPDAALLPATVAESFSYTLSELRALGIPVIATRLGAFAERIRDGEDGLLVAPEAASIVALIQQLQRDQAPLQRIRDALVSQTAPSIETMASAHRSLLTPAMGKVRWHSDSTLGIAMFAARVLAAERERDALRISDTAKDRELMTRTEWAQSLDRDLHSARAEVANGRANAAQMQHALDDVHGRLGQLWREFEERTAWAQSLDLEVARLREEIVAAGARHESAQQAWTLADGHFQRELERLESEKAVLLASQSWRITAPLRALRRRGDRLRVQSGYLVKRATTAIPRLMRSLRVRGLSGTVTRMRNGPSGETPMAAMPLKPVLIETQIEAQQFVNFTVPRADVPRASIIVPVYNKWHYTEACLRSLVAQAQRSSFEVIVVDDGSSDETPGRLAAIEGVIAIRNAENLGFVGSCNAGARLAHGEYLVFLNNDTQVAANWLDALLDTFDQHERVGLVGAKLVYPDGRLQEAGGIVFNDGSGWNYGRFADPVDPSFNYVREADYCSGAAIAIARNLFDRIGGFDTRYAPAYYEDTDLAFEVRRAGLRVIYQPASTVFHFEGITAGTDPNSGIKRFQAINQIKFLDKWRDALATQPKVGQIDIAREHRAKRRVLIIDATTPHPDEDSGSVRLVNLMRVLIAHGHKVSFFAENRAFDGRYTQALQQLGVEVLYHPYMPEPVRWFANHGALLDAVLVSRHYVAAPLVDAIRHYAPQARLIFDTVDLHYLREEREAALAGRDDLRRSAAATKLAELRLVQKADVTLVVSPIEQELLQREVPNARVEVLSNVHEIAPQRAAFEGRADLFFVGGFQHQPNVDAMLWFVHSVWPLIARDLPQARFHIAGSRMPDTIKALAAERVIVHGFLPSLDTMLDGCRLSVAPLRYGAGVKGKVNQSMAHGQPVVATTVAAEGMYLRNEVNVLIGDDAESFAAQVVRLYSDAALWQRLSEGGLANIATHFSFAAATAALKRVLD